MSIINGFEIKNGVLIKYSGTDKNVVIPNGVTSIGYGAFACCSSLTSVTIPRSVKSISSSFFSCFSLERIEVDPQNRWFKSIDGNLYSKDGKTFIKYATGKKEDKFVIPNGVISIHFDAFSQCKSLTIITIPDGVTSIYNGAFCECSSLTSVTLPDSVTSIGKHAFSGCSSLTSIVIPNSVFSIEDYAFMECPNLTIYCEATSEPNGWQVNWNSNDCPVKWGYKTDKETIEIPPPSPIKDFKIRNGVLDRYIGNSETVVIPDGITCISASAFSENHSVKHTLKSLYLPQTLEIIEAGAFIGFDTLERIVIPKSVEVIGRVTFRGCDNLTIYCERKESEIPLDWESRPLVHWNIGKRPVKWGCKIEYKRRPL